MDPLKAIGQGGPQGLAGMQGMGPGNAMDRAQGAPPPPPPPPPPQGNQESSQISPEALLSMMGAQQDQGSTGGTDLAALLQVLQQQNQGQ